MTEQITAKLVEEILESQFGSRCMDDEADRKAVAEMVLDLVRNEGRRVRKQRVRSQEG